MIYEEMAQIFKVLSDKNRIEIVDLLSCGALCACDILTHFNVSQPTLSHHMKRLVSVGIVQSWKDGKKTMYQLNAEKVGDWRAVHDQLFTAQERCICHSADCCGDAS